MCIIVFVDSFTKIAHFVPWKGVPTAKELAEVFVREVFRLHGVPRVMVSDRGTQFTSAF